MVFLTDIGNTFIIPKGQNTVRHVFRWCEVNRTGESEGLFTFPVFWLIKHFGHEGQDVYVLVCPMYVCAQTNAFTGILIATNFIHECHLHGIVSQILSFQFLCPSLSVSQ